MKQKPDCILRRVYPLKSKFMRAPNYDIITLACAIQNQLGDRIDGDETIVTPSRTGQSRLAYWEALKPFGKRRIGFRRPDGS